MKPHIRINGGLWFCQGSGLVGMGYDCKHAYAEWAKLRAMLRCGRFG